MDFKPKGIIAALMTPTDANGNLKERASRGIIKYVIDGGVHGLFAVGTAGEFYAIDKKTKMRITEIAVEEAAGKLPVYFGATSNTTKESIDLAKGAESIGADAVTVLTPSFVKCRDDELYDHFKAIANSISLPVIVYSLPGTTGVGISPKLLGELCHIDNIVGIKDSSGDLSVTEQYVRQSSDNFSVLSGRDTLILATLMYGGAGGVAATANVVPKLVASIYNHYMGGNIEEARVAQFKLAPLRHAFGLGSTSAAMLKAALNLKGMDVGETVAPVKLLGKREKEQLREILKELGE